MEKLKESFKTKETEWETENSALLKRADAEATLKPVTEELSGLKQQINIMSSAIFGKNISPLYCKNHIRNVCRLTHKFIDICFRSAKLGSDMRIRLKAVYTLVEQLYTGTQRTIAAAMHKKSPPTLIKDTLERLSVLPQRIDDLKRASDRAGVLTALSRARMAIRP